MLALTVREGDYVTIGDDVVVQVLKTGDVFRIAIDAPRSMAIQRGKVHEEFDGHRTRRDSESAGTETRKTTQFQTVCAGRLNRSAIVTRFRIESGR